MDSHPILLILACVLMIAGFVGIPLYLHLETKKKEQYPPSRMTEQDWANLEPYHVMRKKADEALINEAMQGFKAVGKEVLESYANWKVISSFYDEKVFLSREQDINNHDLHAALRRFREALDALDKASR